MYQIFEGFPREMGVPRKVVHTQNSFIKYIKAHNGKSSIFSTVYSYRDIDETKPWLADYSRPIINKEFFDIDKTNAFSWFEKLIDFALKKDYVFRAQMSGGGYQLVVFGEEKILMNPRAALNDAQHWFADEAHVKIGKNTKDDGIDPTCIGDVARFMRVTNTWNMRRKAMCIPLTLDMIDRGDEYIRHKSMYPNGSVKKKSEDWVYGSELVDFSKFDHDPSYIPNMPEELQGPVIELEGDAVINLQCPAMRSILKQPYANYRQRYHLILYLRENGYSLSETKSVLKSFLAPEKFKHCLVDEKQPDYIYRRPRLFMSTSDSLKTEGICSFNCDAIDCDVDKLYF